MLPTLASWYSLSSLLSKNGIFMDQWGCYPQGGWGFSTTSQIQSPKAGKGSRSIRKAECTHGEHGPQGRQRQGQGGLQSWEQDAQLLPEEGEMKSVSRVTSELKFDPRDEF